MYLNIVLLIVHLGISLMGVHDNCRKFIRDVGKDTSDKRFAIKHALKQRDYVSILRDLRRYALCLAVLQEMVSDLKSIIDSFEVVQACDVARISRQKYMAIYNVFFNALHVHGLKTLLLPRRYFVKKARKSSNYSM